MAFNVLPTGPSPTPLTLKFNPSLLIALPLLLEASSASATQIFINEIHYDNAGTDTGEFVEIAGPAGTDLTGWSLALYNGTYSLRALDDTIALSGTLSDQTSGYGFLSVATVGLQNGSPDGLALVDNFGSVVQFLSYEGSFEAANGPANGLTSTDIVVTEGSSTPVGHSLQLTGVGTAYSDFTWAGPAANTSGEVNTGQTFAVPDQGATFSLMALGLITLPLARKLRRN